EERSEEPELGPPDLVTPLEQCATPVCELEARWDIVVLDVHVVVLFLPVERLDVLDSELRPGVVGVLDLPAHDGPVVVEVAEVLVVAIAQSIVEPDALICVHVAIATSLDHPVLSHWSRLPLEMWDVARGLPGLGDTPTDSVEAIVRAAWSEKRRL